jgi:hypothetical protein
MKISIISPLKKEFLDTKEENTKKLEKSAMRKLLILDAIKKAL